MTKKGSIAKETVEIVAFDTRGNKASKSLFLERGAIQGTAGPVFSSLNPSGKRVKPNKDALAFFVFLNALLRSIQLPDWTTSCVLLQNVIIQIQGVGDSIS